MNSSKAPDDLKGKLQWIRQRLDYRLEDMAEVSDLLQNTSVKIHWMLREIEEIEGVMSQIESEIDDLTAKKI